MGLFTKALVISLLVLVIVGGFESGQTFSYQVQAKGSSYSDWSDISGQFRAVALPLYDRLLQ